MDRITADRASGRRRSTRLLTSNTAPSPDAAERRPSPIVLPQALDRARIIGVAQAAELLNFSVAHVRRLYRTGKMPKPVSLGGGKLGWKAGVLLDFIDGASGTP